MNQYFNIFGRFILIVILQVLILKNVLLQWWAIPVGFPPFTPNIYPLFILLLPFETPIWVLLIIGFFTGLTIDAFMNTAGIHIFATVLIAYLRTFLITFLLPRELSEYKGLEPSVKTMSWPPFIVYCAFLILIHHFMLYLLLTWSFSNIQRLILQIVASTITSLLLFLTYILLFTKKEMQK